MSIFRRKTNVQASSAEQAPKEPQPEVIITDPALARTEQVYEQIKALRAEQTTQRWRAGRGLAVAGMGSLAIGFSAAEMSSLTQAQLLEKSSMTKVIDYAIPMTIGTLGSAGGFYFAGAAICAARLPRRRANSLEQALTFAYVNGAEFSPAAANFVLGTSMVPLKAAESQPVPPNAAETPLL